MKGETKNKRRAKTESTDISSLAEGTKESFLPDLHIAGKWVLAC